MKTIIHLNRDRRVKSHFYLGAVRIIRDGNGGELRRFLERDDVRKIKEDAENLKIDFLHDFNGEDHETSFLMIGRKINNMYKNGNYDKTRFFNMDVELDEELIGFIDRLDDALTSESFNAEIFRKHQGIVIDSNKKEKAWI